MSGQDDLKSFRVDQFAMGGMGAPMAPAAPAPAAAAPGGKKDAAKDAGYPNIEGLLNDKKKYDAYLETAQATKKKIEEAASKGAAAEKADARKALNAFDDMFEILKTGMELTMKITKEREAKLKAAAQGKK
jgi:hypothetical protein